MKCIPDQESHPGLSRWGMPYVTGQTPSHGLASLALQLGAFLRHDGAIYGTHLLTDATVNADVKGNPAKAGAFGVFSLPGINASDRAGVNTNRHPFTAVRENCMWHQCRGRKTDPRGKDKHPCGLQGTDPSLAPVSHSRQGSGRCLHAARAASNVGQGWGQSSTSTCAVRWRCTQAMAASRLMGWS